MVTLVDTYNRGVIIISAGAVFPCQSLQPLINVGVNIMEFVKNFLSKFSTCPFVKIFPRQNFAPYGMYACTMYACVYVRMYVCVHAYIHIRMHTYVHLYVSTLLISNNADTMTNTFIASHIVSSLI